MLDRFLPFIFILTAVCNCPLQPAEKLVITEQGNFRKQIESVDCDNADRFREVRELFALSGAVDTEIKTEKFGEVENVVVTIPGKTKETVIVGAHYDKTTLGCGAIDNWTGIVLVANLYRTFRGLKNNKTLKFVAFGQEEKGLIGSKAMAKEISEQNAQKHCAMVNFDSFGKRHTWAFENISDKSLIELAEKISREKGLPFDSKEITGASSDSAAFRRYRIPAITFSGLDDNWRDYLHNKNDQVENLDVNKVYNDYRFAFYFLNEIDATSCDAYR